MRAADGVWWPESFYLASLQSRETLYEVSPTSDLPSKRDMSDNDVVAFLGPKGVRG